MKNLSNKDYSVKQEDEIFKLCKGYAPIKPLNSGGTLFGGGDVLTPKFFIEAKTPTTAKQSYTVKKKDLEKATEQAFEQRRSYFTLAFKFDPDGSNFFVIDERMFKMLLAYIEEDEYA